MVKRKTIDFLITFDHDARRQISLDIFRDTDKALKAYSEREAQYRDNSRVEVVLLGADSIEAIKVTHSNYFEDTSKTGGTFKTFTNLVIDLRGRAVPATSPPRGLVAR
jgi:hypothetical protein